MSIHELASPARRADLSCPVISRGPVPRATAGVVAISTFQTLASGDTLFTQGHSADSVYEVVRGTVRLYLLLSDGRRQITGFLSSGRLLGLAFEDRYIYTAEAITQVTLHCYSRARLARLVDQVPGLALRLIDMTSHELGAAQFQMMLLGRKSAIERLASFLLQLVNDDSRNSQGQVQVPMNRTDIADYLGLTTETVSRTFSELKHDGTIELPSSHCVKILKPGRLEALAAGEGPKSRRLGLPVGNTCAANL